MATRAAERLFTLIDLDAECEAPAAATWLLPVRLIERQSTARVRD